MTGKCTGGIIHLKRRKGGGGTVDFSGLRLTEKQPVYLQIARYVKRQILLGNAAQGDTVLSRRELAALTGINPNTVQKAYKLLEDEGYLETPRNAASTVRFDGATLAALEQELTLDLVRDFVRAAKENRLSFRRVVELLSEQWEED